MTTDLATLDIAVNSSEAAKAASDLDRLTDAGKRTEESANKAGAAWTSSIGSIAGDTKRIVAELQNLNQKQTATEKAMSELGNTVNLTALALGNAVAAMQKLASGNATLAKSSDDVSKSTKKVTETQAEAEARLLAVAEKAIALKKAQDDLSASYMSTDRAAKTYTTTATANASANNKMADAIDKLSGKQDKSNKSTKETSESIAAEREELEQLLRQIDPISKKMADLGAQQEKLNKHLASGTLDVETYNIYKAKLDQSAEALNRFDSVLGKSGITAKQTAAALRGVPAQVTDIIVSLQGGQAPFTVFLQQGGQLKDMFGGIGPAAKALSGYILGLVNPFTIAAAAAGALAVAYYQGSQESTNYNKALIMTGNYAGTSSASLAGMAKTVSASVGTTGAAAEALTQLAASGKIASSQFVEIATSALQWQKATGSAVSDTIAEFSKLADSPVKAIADLDDKYHFLTASVYQQIIALQEQGREQDAAKLAEDTYAKALSERSNQIIANLGTIEKAWLGVKNFAKNAWDAMLDIGRENTLEDKLKKLKDDLAYIRNASTNPLSVGDNPDMIKLGKGEKGTNDEINFTELQIEAQKYQEQFLGDIKQRQTQSRQYYDDIRKQIDDTASNEDKRNKAILKQEREIAQARVDGYKITADEEAKLIQNIKDKYKDPAKPKGQNVVDMTVFNDAENALKSLVDTYNNSEKELDSLQKNGLINQQEYVTRKTALITEEKDKTTSAYQAEIAALEEIKARSTTTGNQRIQIDQKIADVRTAMVKASQASEEQLKQVANDEAGRLKKQTLAVDAYTDALNEQIKALQLQGARTAAGVAMSASQKAVFDQLNAVTDKINNARLQLANQYGDGSRGMSLDEYNLKLKALETAHTDMTKTVIENQRQLEAAQGNWLNGAKSAFAEYIASASDVAGQTKSAFTSAFSSLEDVFTKFITTGKLSFKDFADTVISELSRIVVKQQIIAPLLKSIFGDAAGGVSSGSSGGALGGGTGSSFTDLLSYGKTAIQLATTGVGSAAIEGFKAGSGLIGSLSGGGTAAYNSLVGSIAGNTAAIGASQAGYTSSAFANWAASGGSSAGAAGAGGAVSAAGAGLSAGGAALYGIGGILAGYQANGIKGAIGGGVGAAGGAYAGAAAGTAAGTAIGGTLGSVVPVVGTILGAAIGTALGSKLFGGSWVTKNAGIQLAVNDGDLASNSFEYQKKKGGLFSSNKKRTKLGYLDEETQTALDDAYDKTQTSVEDLFKTLNVKFNDAILDGLNVGVLQISTKDNTAEQVQEKITAWFGTVADAMVGAINTGATAGLEGYNFESLTAFVNNLVSVNQVLTNLKVGVFDFSVAGGKMAEQLSALAGGFENLKTNAATYYDKFFTDTEKADDVLSAVRKQFEAVNVALPSTRDGFRAAIQGLDITTEAGRTMFATLTALSGNASQLYDILEQRSEAATAKAKADAEAAAQALQTLLTGNLNNAFSKLQRSISAEQDKGTKSYNDLTASLNDTRNAASATVSALDSIGNSLSSALKSVMQATESTTGILRKQAKQTIQEALTTVRSGKTLENFEGLTDALQTLSQNDASNYATLNDYLKEQGETANEINQLNQLNGKQLSNAEKTVKGIDSQLAQAKLSYDAQMAQYASQLAYAQSQLDALNGIDSSITSVTAAIQALNSAIVASLGAKPATGTGSASNNTSANNSTIVDTLYQSLFGRTPDAGENKYWSDRLTSGNLPYSEIAANMTKYASAADKAYLALHPVKGYSGGTGATTASGWMTVGEQGPELMRTGPVSIKSNAQSKQFMKDSDAVMAAKLDQMIILLQAQKDYAYTTAKNTGTSAQRLEDINDRELAA